GGYEDGGLAVLHPGQKRRQQAGGDSGVGASGIGAAASKDFFQFVDPQNARGEAFGYAEDLLDALLGFADEFVVDGGGVEFHQRKLPFSGYGLRAETLAAALDAEDDDAFGRIEAELAGAIVPGAATLFEPALQVVETADARHVVGGFHEIQHFGALQQRLLGVENIGDAVGRKRHAAHDSLRDHAFGGFFGQAAEIAGHRVDAIRVELEFQGMGSSHAGVGFADDFAQAAAVGEREIEKLYQSRKFGRHFDGGGGQHQSPAVSGEFLPYVAQTAHDDGIVQVAMEILEHEYGFD